MAECEADVLLLGPYGSGKSTVARSVASVLGCECFDAGGELRRFATSTDPDSAMIAGLMANGELVPVRFTVGLLNQKMEAEQRSRFVIDGTPRSTEQLIAFEEMLVRHGRTVISFLLQISDETSVMRQTHRDHCLTCGERLLTNRCGKCGTLREARLDASDRVARLRLSIYHQQFGPVVDFYRARGMLIINAEAPLEHVIATVLMHIRASAHDRSRSGGIRL